MHIEVEIRRESVCQSVSEMNESVSQISVVLIASVAAAIAAAVASVSTIAAAESGQLRAAWDDEWWSEINWSFAHFVL